MRNNDAMQRMLAIKSEEKREDAFLNVSNQPTGDRPLSKSNEITKGAYTDEWLRESLKRADVPILGEKNGAKGIRIYHVPCPNESEHTDKGTISAASTWIYNGYPVFKCQHHHCANWKFADFAEAVGISYHKGVGRVPDSENPCFSMFHEFNDKGQPNKVLQPVICKWICENYTFFILSDLPFFINENGKYEIDEGGARMRHIIKSCIADRLCTDGTVTSIYKMILYEGNRKEYEELNKYPVEWVPFKNGFYIPIENRMTPILPEHFVINQIPHEYYPDAECECPTFDNLLSYQLPNEDERELWLQFCGSTFNRDVSAQKWMIVRGRGGTGKSTQLNILIDCLGHENVSNETLQGLCERFGATILFGKLANICADISSEDMNRVDVLKKITGEDRNGVKYERKGKDSFFFTPFCKLLFSANEIPMNRDEKSDAFYRRVEITVMDKKPKKVDRNLGKKLASEIDGIIHRYMAALGRFYANGGQYPNSRRSKEEVKNLRHITDSVIAFMEDRLIKDVDCYVSREEMFNAYNAYCGDEERRFPVARNTLFARLRNEGFEEGKRRIIVRGKIVSGTRCFLGCRIKDDFEEVNPQEVVKF